MKPAERSGMSSEIPQSSRCSARSPVESVGLSKERTTLAPERSMAEREARGGETEALARQLGGGPMMLSCTTAGSDAGIPAHPADCVLRSERVS